MSWRQPQQPQAFRETLSFQDVIRNQIQKCAEAFNVEDLKMESATVQNLRTMLSTPAFSDNQFDTDIQVLLESQEQERAQKLDEHKKRLRKAVGCPDVVPPPNLMPGEDHWRQMYLCCLSLCERNGITMTPKRTDSVGLGPNPSMGNPS